MDGWNGRLGAVDLILEKLDGEADPKLVETMLIRAQIVLVRAGSAASLQLSCSLSLCMRYDGTLRFVLSCACSHVHVCVGVR
jgi:hypothetical protein